MLEQVDNVGLDHRNDHLPESGVVRIGTIFYQRDGIVEVGEVILWITDCLEPLRSKCLELWDLIFVCKSLDFLRERHGGVVSDERIVPGEIVEMLDECLQCFRVIVHKLEDTSILLPFLLRIRMQQYHGAASCAYLELSTKKLAEER